MRLNYTRTGYDWQVIIGLVKVSNNLRTRTILHRQTWAQQPLCFCLYRLSQSRKLHSLTQKSCKSTTFVMFFDCNNNVIFHFDIYKANTFLPPEPGYYILLYKKTLKCLVSLRLVEVGGAGLRAKRGDTYLLQSCRDGNDFLDGAAQPLYVITPVKNLEHRQTQITTSEATRTQSSHRQSLDT